MPNGGKRHMASAGARAYNGGLEQSPSGVQGVEPPVRVRGRSSLKLKEFGRQKEIANLPTSLHFANSV